MQTRKMNNLARSLISVKIDDNNNKGIVLGGDFNLFFEDKLEEQEGNPLLKKISLAK